MKNISELRDRIKNEIFNIKKYEEKTSELDKEKSEIGENIKQYISKNKSIFKKKRLSDYITPKKCMVLGFSITGLMFLFAIAEALIFGNSSGNNNDDILTKAFNALIIINVASMFSFLISRFFPSEKNKALLYIKYFKNSKRKKMNELKIIANEKNAIEKLINGFKDKDLEEVVSVPASVDIIKSLPSYFSKSEIEKISFNADDGVITYKNIIDFIIKNERYEKQLKMVEVTQCNKEAL